MGFIERRKPKLAWKRRIGNQQNLVTFGVESLLLESKPDYFGGRRVLSSQQFLLAEIVLFKGI